MSQSLDSIYDDPHYNIFLKTVGANDEHMSRFPINVVRTIRNRVIRFVGTDSSCSSNIKDIMMWLKCLAKVLQDSKYIIYNGTLAENVKDVIVVVVVVATNSCPVLCIFYLSN